MTRVSRWTWVQALAGVVILALLAWRVGAGPFIDGIRNIDGRSIAAAVALGAVAIACCAWRWSVVAAGLGVRLPMREAFAAYYRALFLNVTLPGGVAGDVHRAVRHGADIGNVGLGVRAVLLERLAGQTVMAVVAGVVLLAMPSPVRAHLVTAASVVIALGLGSLLAMWTFGAALRRGPSRPWLRRVETVWVQVRRGLLAPRVVARVVVASTVMVLSNVAIFVLAARTAGATASVSLLVPLAVLALLAMSVPLNLAGWGPREGVTAWAFSAAGLTAAQGVATAVTYGVLVLAACLPGAIVLILRWLRRSRRTVPLWGRGETSG